MLIQGVVRVLTNRAKDGHSLMPVKDIPEEFKNLWKVPFSLQQAGETDAVTFLQKWPNNVECFQDGTEWMVRLAKKGEDKKPAAQEGKAATPPLSTAKVPPKAPPKAPATTSTASSGPPATQTAPVATKSSGESPKPATGTAPASKPPAALGTTSPERPDAAAAKPAATKNGSMAPPNSVPKRPPAKTIDPKDASPPPAPKAAPSSGSALVASEPSAPELSEQRPPRTGGTVEVNSSVLEQILNTMVELQRQVSSQQEDIKAILRQVKGPQT